MTKAELLDRGLWDLFCELRSIANWESAEAIEPITLTEGEAAQLGLREYPRTCYWGISPLQNVLAYLIRMNRTWRDMETRLSMDAFWR